MQRIHLIGICGTAMATLAALLKHRGHDVRGSDQNVYPPMSDFLRQQGITTLQGYSREHITADLDLVVVGNAISRGNPELEEVLDRKIRYCSLPEAVRDHFLWGARSIVIAGTHGKTTTTSLTGWLLTHGGADPSVFIGGIAENFESSYRDRRRPRVRHRGGRVRQRVLRQDREVPEVPAGHRRRQQHRVRPRRHLSGSRRDPAGLPALRQPRSAARPAAPRRRQRRGARRCASRAHAGSRLRSVGRRRLAGARSEGRRATSTTFSVRRDGHADRRVRGAAARRLQRAQRAGGDRRRRGGRPEHRHDGRRARAFMACGAGWSSAARRAASRSTTTSRIIRPRLPRRSTGVRSAYPGSPHLGDLRAALRDVVPADLPGRISRARWRKADHVILPAVFRSTLPEDQRLSTEQLVADLKAAGVDARYIPRVDDIVADGRERGREGDSWSSCRTADSTTSTEAARRARRGTEPLRAPPMNRLADPGE